MRLAGIFDRRKGLNMRVNDLISSCIVSSPSARSPLPILMAFPSRRQQINAHAGNCAASSRTRGEKVTTQQLM